MCFFVGIIWLLVLYTMEKQLRRFIGGGGGGVRAGMGYPEG